MARSGLPLFVCAFLAAGLAAVMGLSSPAFAKERFRDAETAYYQSRFSASYPLFQALAREGNAAAQYMLGRHYQFGQGVPKNNIRAHVWYSRAATQGHDEAKLFRHLLETRWAMPKAEIAEAERLLAEDPTGAGTARKPETAHGPKERTPPTTADGPARLPKTGPDADDRRDASPPEREEGTDDPLPAPRYGDRDRPIEGRLGDCRSCEAMPLGESGRVEDLETPVPQRDEPFETDPDGLLPFEDESVFHEPYRAYPLFPVRPVHPAYPAPAFRAPPALDGHRTRRPSRTGSAPRWHAPRHGVQRGAGRRGNRPRR